MNATDGAAMRPRRAYCFYLVLSPSILALHSLSVLLGVPLVDHAEQRSVRHAGPLLAAPPDARATTTLVFEQSPVHTRAAQLDASWPCSVTVALAARSARSASYALGRFNFRGRTAGDLPDPVDDDVPADRHPGLALTMINQFHLYNTLWALIITYLIFTLPFTVWVLTSFFQADAQGAGGSGLRGRRHAVADPLPGDAAAGGARPGDDRAAGLHRGLERVPVRALVHPDARQPHRPAAPSSTSCPRHGGGFEIPWGQIMAATIIVTMPLIVLTLIFQRRILAGLTAGAVKGDFRIIGPFAPAGRPDHRRACLR